MAHTADGGDEKLAKPALAVALPWCPPWRSKDLDVGARTMWVVLGSALRCKADAGHDSVLGMPGGTSLLRNLTYPAGGSDCVCLSMLYAYADVHDVAALCLAAVLPLRPAIRRSTCCCCLHKHTCRPQCCNPDRQHTQLLTCCPTGRPCQR